MQFIVLWRRGSLFPSFSSSSNTVTVRGGDAYPAQIHLAITESVDEMIISFVTGGTYPSVLHFFC